MLLEVRRLKRSTSLFSLFVVVVFAMTFINLHLQNLEFAASGCGRSKQFEYLKNRLDKNWCKRVFRFHYDSDAFEELCTDIQGSGHSSKH